jgi:hypothetical protein
MRVEAAQVKLVNTFCFPYTCIFIRPSGLNININIGTTGPMLRESLWSRSYH